jgi:surfeit locus 1 family protein
MQTYTYRFRPKLIPTLATLILLPVLINLGLWQSHKADSKQALQGTYDTREKRPPLPMGAHPVDPEAILFSRVFARGHYDPAFQVLLDNQVYQGKAGYQVITPLQIEGSAMRVLVYRGWVPVGADRRILPQIEPPQGLVEVSGYAHIPSNKYFELRSDDVRGDWQKVWQNLDLKRYSREVPFAIQPVAILLEANSAAGGYVRDWPQPDVHIEVNRGYALQWFGMSVALVLIYLVTNIKRVPQ